MRILWVLAELAPYPGSVCGMDCAAALEALESLHARERARAMSIVVPCHTTVGVSSSYSYILYGLRTGRSQVYF